MKASSLSFQAGVVLIVVGMIWGIQMGITRDHSAMPAHAHLNLLGFVTLLLFGFYYRLHPSLDRSRAALVQIAVWIVGTIVMIVGVALVHSGREAGDSLAAIGALVVLAAMLYSGGKCIAASADSWASEVRLCQPNNKSS